MVRCSKCNQRLYGAERVTSCIERDCPMVEQRALPVQLSMELFTTSQKKEGGAKEKTESKDLTKSVESKLL